MASVTLEKIPKSYGATRVIENLNLAIADREFVVLVGPSGCGKTTTLRMIAGLESVSSGAIRIGDRNVTKARQGLRNCVMALQSGAVFPKPRADQRDRRVTLGVHPENTSEAAPAPPPPRSRCAPSSRRGGTRWRWPRSRAPPVTVQLEAHARPEPGATVAVAFDMSKMHAFDAETGAAL